MQFSSFFDYTVYSFLDLSAVIAHPDFGSFVFTEGGVGQIVVAMANDKTFHEVDVRGTVVGAKIPSHNGQIHIQCQETSNIHKWLQWSYNILHQADSKKWMQMSATMRNICDGTSHEMRGMSFNKIPDKAYASQGQMVEWILLAAHIVSTSNNPSMVGKQFINRLSSAGEAIASRLEIGI